MPDLLLTQFPFSEKTLLNLSEFVGRIRDYSPIGKEALPVYNVLLSVFALCFSGQPETDGTSPAPDLGKVVFFQNDNEISVSPLLERPNWLRTSEPDQPVFRAQGPAGGYQSPPLTTPLGSPYPTYQPTDPYQGGADPVLPFLNDPGPTVISGINGPQPHRFGFTPIFDGTFIAPSKAKSPGQGNFVTQEYDAGLRHVSMLIPDWVFTNTLQGGVRIWNGPNTPDLPGSVYRVGWDFLLSSPQAGPWSAQFDFNPSLNSDFHGALGREALNLDGNATAFYRVSNQLLLVLGVQYWDRVDKIFIPNAGVVWNPTDRLEARILFPKSRISYFLGNMGNASHWLYATGEYHVESYQIQTPGLSGQNQVQISDYRFAIGLRSDHQWYDKYFEVGYVLGRQVEYLHSTPGFDISDGLMARLGVRF